jgi:hypothetical protein
MTTTPGGGWDYRRPEAWAGAGSGPSGLPVTEDGVPGLGP